MKLKLSVPVLVLKIARCTVGHKLNQGLRGPMLIKMLCIPSQNTAVEDSILRLQIPGQHLTIMAGYLSMLHYVKASVIH